MASSARVPSATLNGKGQSWVRWLVAGAEAMRRKGLVLALQLMVFLYADVRLFQRPREDWEAASAAVETKAIDGCVTFLPADAQPTYTYFRPTLKDHVCASGGEALTERVVLAISPYHLGSQDPGEELGLTARGLERLSQQSFHGPRVEVWGKR